MSPVQRRVAVLSLFLFAGPAAGETFKCADGTGRLVYQQSPCAKAPRPTALPPIDSFARASEYDIVLALTTYPRCARQFPDFAATTAASYQAWRAENAAAVARLEPQLARSADPQVQLAEAGKWTAEERAARRRSCEDFAGRTFPPVAPAGGTSR